MNKLSQMRNKQKIQTWVNMKNKGNKCKYGWINKVHLSWEVLIQFLNEFQANLSVFLKGKKKWGVKRRHEWFQVEGREEQELLSERREAAKKYTAVNGTLLRQRKYYWKKLWHVYRRAKTNLYWKKKHVILKVM